jgi:hypothetical protein
MLRAALLFLLTSMLSAGPADWVPLRWPSGEVASLERLQSSPFNCLLLERGALNQAFHKAAQERGLTILSIARPGQAEAALAFADGIVLEGDFPAAEEAKLEAAAKSAGRHFLRLPLRGNVNIEKDQLVYGSFQGVWPGVNATEHDEAKAMPSGAPWIDTNGGFLRFLSAAVTAPVWIANRPPAQQLWPAARYLQAIGDAAIAGGRWVVALDDNLSARLLKGESKALRDWAKICEVQRFLEEQRELRRYPAQGQLAVLQDVDSGGLLSGGVLDMIAVKHTPIRPVPLRKLAAKNLDGAKMAVNVDPSSTKEEGRQILRGFTRGGGALLTAPPGWKMPTPGAGQITLAKEDIDKLDQIWKEVNTMTGRRNLGARLFNVSSMLSTLSGPDDGSRVVLQLVNYSDYPVDSITVHLLGNFRSAKILRPGRRPAELKPYENEDGVGVDIDLIDSVAILVAER